MSQSTSLPPIDKSKRDAHHGNQNELQAVGLQKFHDFFKSKATSIPFDSSSVEMPGVVGKTVDIRVGPNFELHPLLETAMPLEKSKLGKFDLELWQKALDFGKQKYDTFELSEKEKGLVALVIRQKRQAELQAKQQAELQAKQQAMGLSAAAAATPTRTAAQQQPKQLTKEEEEAERKRLKREKKARKAEKRERKRVKRENPNMEGGGGENTKTGDTTTSMGTKTTAGPTAGTYSTKS